MAKRVKAFRFDPFDEELITDYLKPKIMGEPLPCNTVKDREIYGPSCSPWRVFDPDDHSSWLKSPHVKASEKFMYVFARLSKISSSSGLKNTSKRAGCGTWVGKNKRDRIKDGEGNLIGEKRYLVFEINEVDCGETGAGFYSMHEYSLSGVNEGLDSAGTTVLCRVTYDSAKKATISPKPGARVAGHVSASGGQGGDKKEIDSNNLEGAAAHVSASGGQERDKKEIDSKNLEGSSIVTAENVAVFDCGVGDLSAIVPLDNGVQGSNDFGGGLDLDDLGGMDFCFNDLEFDTDWITNYLYFSQEEEPFLSSTIDLCRVTYESAKKTTISRKPGARVAAHVSANGVQRGDQKEIDSKNLGGTSIVTAKNVAVFDCGVGDQSAIVQLNNGVQGPNDFGGDLELDDLGGLDLCFNDLEFNTDWIRDCLDFSQDEEPFQDSTIDLGKRKFQSEENSYQAKKMCLDNYY